MFSVNTSAQCEEGNYSIVDGVVYSCFNGEIENRTQIINKKLHTGCQWIDIDTYPHTIYSGQDWNINITSQLLTNKNVSFCIYSKKDLAYDIYIYNGSDWFDVSHKINEKYTVKNWHLKCGNVTLKANKTYQLKIKPLIQEFSLKPHIEKTGIFIKRQIDSFQEAYLSGLYCYQDPWLNVTFQQCRNITITNNDIKSHGNEIVGHPRGFLVSDIDLNGATCREGIRLSNAACNLSGVEINTFEVVTQINQTACRVKFVYNETLNAGSSDIWSIYYYNNTPVEAPSYNDYGGLTCFQQIFSNCTPGTDINSCPVDHNEQPQYFDIDWSDTTNDNITDGGLSAIVGGSYNGYYMTGTSSGFSSSCGLSVVNMTTDMSSIRLGNGKYTSTASDKSLYVNNALSYLYYANTIRLTNTSVNLTTHNNTVLFNVRHTYNRLDGWVNDDYVGHYDVSCATGCQSVPWINYLGDGEIVHDYTLYVTGNQAGASTSRRVYLNQSDIVLSDDFLSLTTSTSTTSTSTSTTSTSTSTSTSTTISPTTTISDNITITQEDIRNITAIISELSKKSTDIIDDILFIIFMMSIALGFASVVGKIR